MSEKDRYLSDYALLESEYALIFSQIWSVRSSNILHENHEHVSDNRHYVYFYDNVSEFYDGLVQNAILYHAVCLLEYDEFKCLPRSPNEFPENVAKTQRMTYWYNMYCKDKKIRDTIQQKQYYKFKQHRVKYNFRMNFVNKSNLKVV